MLVKDKVNIIIDGQFGSTGKGALASIVHKTAGFPVDVAMTNAAPNAGHTFKTPGHEIEGGVTFHLPVVGVLQKDSMIYLTAGSMIDPDLLEKEVQDMRVDIRRIVIHPHATIIGQHHRDAEKDASSGAAKIASTQKGVGAALADKINRKGNVAKNCRQLLDAGFRISKFDVSGLTCVMEVPQGFSLSLNHGHEYPFVTSRDVTVAQALNDAGVHPRHLGNVLLSLRTHPIRVGNLIDENGVEIGNSGQFFPDSVEKTWAEFDLPEERTTVTKRVRRVATFSQLQYAQALRMLAPDYVYLNFCNHLKSDFDFFQLVQEMRRTERAENVDPVHMYGYGPTWNDATYDEKELLRKIAAPIVEEAANG